jgi:apolipoprotein N-acyltransferase
MPYLVLHALMTGTPLEFYSIRSYDETTNVLKDVSIPWQQATRADIDAWRLDLLDALQSMGNDPCPEHQEMVVWSETVYGWLRQHFASATQTLGALLAEKAPEVYARLVEERECWSA